VATSGFTRVLQGAGLTHIELARLYEVSRQTIHAWAKGTPPRAGSHTARAAEVITAALLNSIERKVLPFANVSREVRAARISRMARTLQGLKLAPREAK